MLKVESSKKRPELVAPAGDWESLKVAVEQGADAVYLGLKDFNARRQAVNFSFSELKKALDYAHLRGVGVYLAFNTLIFPSEIKKALEMLVAAWNAGVDAVLLQDWGLINLVSSHYPEVRVHLSTQVNVHNSFQLKVLKDFPVVKRVVLARELSLKEIKKLKKETDLEFEVFVHGALCCSYSGLCLFSSLVGGKSGNRGLCTQPCRLAYELIETSDDFYSGQLRTKHYLSLKDLAAVSLLPELIETGVEALKIEGRLKSSYYVGVATGVYRRAIDYYLENPQLFKVETEDFDRLKEAYSRGFTEGHLLGKRGEDLVSLTRPSHRGFFLGRVKHINRITGELVINFKKLVQVGDEIEVWVKEGKKVREKVNKLLVGGEEKAYASGEANLFATKNRHLISVGDRVFKVKSARQSEVTELLQQRKARRVNYLSGKVSLITGKLPELKVFFEGKEFVFQGDILVKKAIRKSLSEEKVKSKLNAFGSFPFNFSELEVRICPDAYLSLKELGKLRRLAEEHLIDYILGKYRREKLKFKLEEFANFRSRRERKKLYIPKLTARVRDFSQARAALRTNINRIAFEVSIWRGDWETDWKHLFKVENKKELGIVIPPVVREKELYFWMSLAERLKPFKPFLVCGEVGMASFFLKEGFSVLPDFHFNIANPYVPWEELVSKGEMIGIVPSLELNLESLKKLREVSPFPLELVVYGWPRVMISESCFFEALEVSCQKQCQQGNYFLRDKLGYEFPLEFDRFCRLNLFNSRCFYLLSSLDLIWKSGFSCFQLLFLRERAKEVKEVCSLAVELVELLKKGHKPEIGNHKLCTTGHYFREVF